MSKLSRIAGKVFLSSVKCAQLTFHGNIYFKNERIYFLLDGDINSGSIEKSFNDEKNNLEKLTETITKFLVDNRNHDALKEYDIPEKLNLTPEDYGFSNYDEEMCLYLPIKKINNHNNEEDESEDDELTNDDILNDYEGGREDFIKNVINKLEKWLDKQINVDTTGIFSDTGGTLSIKTSEESGDIHLYKLTLNIYLDVRKNNRYFQITTAVSIKNNNEKTIYTKSFYVTSDFFQGNTLFKDIKKKKNNTVSFKFQDKHDNLSSLNDFKQNTISALLNSYEKDLNIKIPDNESEEY